MYVCISQTSETSHIELKYAIMSGRNIMENRLLQRSVCNSASWRMDISASIHTFCNTTINMLTISHVETNIIFNHVWS